MSETEIATVLPKELRLGVPPKMPQARSYLFRQQSTISSYSPGGTIQINIPRLQRSYLTKDSTLRFSLTGTWTTNASARSQFLAFDTCGAWGLFEKMEVFDYLGSTVLESISGVPQLMSLLLDLGLDNILDKSNGNASYGLSKDYVSSKTLVPIGGGVTAAGAFTSLTTPSTTDIAPLTSDRTITVTQVASGQGEVNPPTTGVVLDATPNSATTPASETRKFAYEFSIPLPSFLGFLSDKMIPLHNGFTIVLTLASQYKPFVSGIDYSANGPYVTNASGGGPITVAVVGDISGKVGTAQYTNSTSSTAPVGSLIWTVQDVYMQCQILELGPVAESMIMSSTQGQPLIVNTKAMRYYTGNVKGGNWSSGLATESNGASDFTLNLNLNVASLTNILWFMRSGSYADKFEYNSCGHRTRNFLHRWYFQYGSTTLPQSNGIQTMALSLPTGYQVTSTTTGAWTSGKLNTYTAQQAMCTESFIELMNARPKYLAASRFNGTNYSTDFKFNASLDRSYTGSSGTYATSAMYGLFNLLGVYASPRHPLGIGRFACGLNLELAPYKQGSIISGLNTNGMNTSIRGQFHPSYLNMMDSVTIDAYAEYDAFINISPGIATTVSF